jgi:hypothetical protein
MVSLKDTMRVLAIGDSWRMDLYLESQLDDTWIMEVEEYFISSINTRISLYLLECCISTFCNPKKCCRNYNGGSESSERNQEDTR